MELKLLILSVACFSCLIPSAVTFNLLAAHAVAHQAAQDLAAIKADTISAKKGAVLKAFSDIADITANGIALKGQVIKNAAVSIAGSLLNGFASVGSTLAKAGMDLIAAKFGMVPPKPPCINKPPQLIPPPNRIVINRPDNIIPSFYPPPAPAAQYHHPLIYPPVVPERSFYRKPTTHHGFKRPAGSRFAIMDMPRFDAQAFEAFQYGKK